MLDSFISNEEYEKIVNITLDILGISYIDENYKYVNPAYYKTFEYRKR